MSDPIQIEVKGDAVEYLQKLQDPAKVYPVLQQAMNLQNQFTLGHITRDYMSLPSDGPKADDKVRVISDRLRGSMRASLATVTSNGVESAIGSNVVYARILEEGGQTRPHVITAKNAKALHFNGVFRRSVHHPGSKFSGRHFVRRGIEDRLGDYSRAFSEAIFRL